MSLHTNCACPMDNTTAFKRWAGLPRNLYVTAPHAKPCQPRASQGLRGAWPGVQMGSTCLRWIPAHVVPLRAQASAQSSAWVSAKAQPLAWPGNTRQAGTRPPARFADTWYLTRGTRGTWQVPAIVGVVRVVREAYPDHFAFNKSSKYYDERRWGAA